MVLQAGQNEDGHRFRRASGEDSAEARTAQADESLVRAQERVAILESSLESQARAHADLIHLLCHELRTPITVISGFARLLMEPTNGSLNERQFGFVSESLKASQRLNGLVGDLLDASSESGSVLAVESKPGDLNATIQSTLSSLAPLWADRVRMKLATELDPAIPEMNFDSARIVQVLTNLLTNAIRYGRPDGTVRIGSCVCDHDGERAVQVYVEDDGPGIPVLDRRRIFEPYVRGNPESACAGMGIGLAICHRIVASHAGWIRVEDSSLGGARFVFSMPVAPGASLE